MSDTIKVVDGPKREFSTGAESQDASGKGTPVLVPGDAILDIAKHFENGAAIYGPRNWEKGIPLSEQLNSLERHLQQEKMGLTEEPHARALAWRAIVYLATKLRIEEGILPAELADMPRYEQMDRNCSMELHIKNPAFKKGDRVRITLRSKGPQYRIDTVRREKGVGIYEGPISGFDGLHCISISDFDYFDAHTDELTLLEDN